MRLSQRTKGGCGAIRANIQFHAAAGPQRLQFGGVQFAESRQADVLDEETDPRVVTVAAIAVLVEDPLHGLSR